MIQFTPVASLIGGALIGLAAAFLMALNGRVAGISGITAGLLSWEKPEADAGWRLAFVFGLVPLLRQSSISSTQQGQCGLLGSCASVRDRWGGRAYSLQDFK